jgi:DNA-binding NarL/FixJ family response regulator
MVTLNLEMQHSTFTENRPETHIDLTQSEILVITVCENEPNLESAVNNSSNRYVIRDHYLAQALLNISKRAIDVSPEIETTSSSREIDLRKDKNAAELSDREEEVLELLAEGESNRAIAASLFISENTVKTHLRHIMTKLDVANRSQAAVYAIKTQLIHKR